MTNYGGFAPIGDPALGAGGPWTRVGTVPGQAGTATDTYTSPTGAQLRVLVAPGGTQAAVDLVAAADRVALVGTNAAGIHGRGVGTDGSVWVALTDHRLASVADLARTGVRLEPNASYRSADTVLGILDGAQTAGVHGLSVTPDTVHVAPGGSATVVDLLTVTEDPARGTVTYHPDGDTGPAVVPLQTAAVGAVLYSLLTGRPGTVGSPPPSSVTPGLDPRFDLVPGRALAADPAARYSTLSAMRADIAGTAAAAAAPVAVVAAPVAAKSSGGKVAGIIAALVALALIGGGIWWFLSQGSTTAVPNLVGQTSTAAQAQITGAGFALGTVTQAKSDKAVGTVVAQDPAAGAQAKSGAGINLTVSSGPGEVTVPSVVGQSQSGATNVLLAAGLALGTVKQVPSTQPAGVVLTQAPTPGAKVAPGTKVNIEVSSGTVSVPDVVGQTSAVAQAAITNAGFNVTVQTAATAQPGAAPGSVIKQTPAAGSDLAQGGTVVLTVYEPASPTPTATPTPTPTST